jgi:hypothetical protein
MRTSPPDPLSYEEKGKPERRSVLTTLMRSVATIE